MPHFRIDIISDVVCPWCYIGHLRLQRAISLFTRTHPLGSGSTFTTKWHPFYLDPGAPTQGTPLRERMAQRFGGTDRVDAMQARLAAIGLREGVAFDFGSRIGRTRDVHRLVELAGRVDDERQQQQQQSTQAKQATTAAADDHGGVQNRLVTLLFEGYFTGAQDITSTAWLESVAREAGLSASLIKEWRERDAGGAQVDTAAAANRNVTSGVPRFTINGQWVVEGAQDVDEFLVLFGEIAEQSHEGDSSGSGGGERAMVKADAC